MAVMTGWRMDLDQLRAQTPGCWYRIHLNNAGAALMSRSTLEAMTTHLRLEAEVGGYEAAARAREQIDVTYAALAQLVAVEAMRWRCSTTRPTRGTPLSTRSRWALVTGS